MLGQVEWHDITHAAAFLIGWLVGIVTTMRLAKIISDRWPRDKHSE